MANNKNWSQSTVRMRGQIMLAKRQALMGSLAGQHLLSRHSSLSTVFRIIVLNPISECNIMWAGHQTHHSSQEYNLTTALRQSFIHRYIGLPVK